MTTSRRLIGAAVVLFGIVGMLTMKPYPAFLLFHHAREDTRWTRER